MVQLGSCNGVKRRPSNNCRYHHTSSMHDINSNQKNYNMEQSITTTLPFIDDTEVNIDTIKTRQPLSTQTQYKNRNYSRRRSQSYGSLPSGISTFFPRQPLAPQRRLSINASPRTKIKGVKFTSSQHWTLICLSVVSFTSMLSMSIIAPFFPLEASLKGMRETVYGFVFSVYALIVMVMSPFAGMVMPQIGPKFMLISGIFVAGSSNILFGALDRINDLSIFTAFCFTVRIFEALGAAAFSTASYTIIMQTFPDNIGTAFGIVETCVGLGMSLGPAIGGGLYGLGGYGLPFYVLGCLMLMTLPLCWYIIKPLKAKPMTKISLWSYLKLISIPQVLVVGIVVVVTSQTISFLDPTVEPHFREMNISPEYVSLVFLLLSGGYTISSPIVGWFAGLMDNKFPIMALGLFLSCDALLLLGPSFIIPIDPSLWLSVLSMVLIGIAYAIAFIPTFESILDISLDHGFGDNISTYSLVSGLWSAMYSLGEVTGPSLGGWLSENYDFSIAVTFMAAFSLLGSIIAGITCFCVRYDDSKSHTSDSDEEFDKSGWRSSRKNSKSEHNSLLNDKNAKYGTDERIHQFIIATV